MAARVPEAANLVELVSRAVERFPDSVAFTGDDGTLTYRALHELSCRIANGLCTAGIGKGAKVGVYSPNSSVSFACVLGALRAGAVWVPLNPQIRSDVASACFSSRDIFSSSAGSSPKSLLASAISASDSA